MIEIYSLYQMFEEYEDVEVKALIQSFQCPLNKGVESFLKEKAYLYEKYNISRTYLILHILEDQAVELLAYFSLAIKEFTFGNDMKNNQKRRILHTGFQADREVPAILIGQLGKNYDSSLTMQIDGTDILYAAFQYLMDGVQILGGRIAYLEAVHHPKICSFYEKEHFICCVDEKGCPKQNAHGLLTFVRSIPNCI